MPETKIFSIKINKCENESFIFTKNDDGKYLYEILNNKILKKYLEIPDYFLLREEVIRELLGVNEYIMVLHKNKFTVFTKLEIRKLTDREAKNIELDVEFTKFDDLNRDFSLHKKL